MAYRGYDASRPQADRGNQPPRDNGRYAEHGQPEYGHDDDYGPTDGYGDPPAYGQYAGHGYQQAGDRPAGYGQADDFDQSGYAQPGYAQPGYPQPQPGPGYDQGYGPSGSYREQGSGYGQPGGYQNGGYQNGGYQAQDAGNDWYGGQPAASSGASFADTGTFTLSGRTADEYGVAPGQPLRRPARGYPLSADPAAPGYPAPVPPSGRPFPPAPRAASGPIAFPRTGPQAARRTGPQAGPRTGPHAIPHTGQQERYDGYDPRGETGRRGYDGSGAYADPNGYGGRGHEAFDNPPGYSPAPVGGQRDGYDDYASGADPFPDRDNHSGRSGTGRAAAARTGSAGQPRLGRSRGRRPFLLAAIAVVAVVVVGVAAYVFVLRPKSPASGVTAAGVLPTSGSVPANQACVQQYGTYCHIEMSVDDPTPLVVSDLFPPAFTNEADKSSFSLVSTKLDKTCSRAVIGKSLISALKAGKCTQVLRASYVSGTGKMMGTIGVVNLSSTNEAHYAGKVVGENDFIAPLAAAKGVAKKLGQGTGVVEAEFKGHYLILTWSEFVNGTTPSTKTQDSELEQFSSDLVAGTANISLSQRMVTGVAPAPGASTSAAAPAASASPPAASLSPPAASPSPPAG